MMAFRVQLECVCKKIRPRSVTSFCAGFWSRWFLVTIFGRGQKPAREQKPASLVSGSRESRLSPKLLNVRKVLKRYDATAYRDTASDESLSVSHSKHKSLPLILHCRMEETLRSENRVGDNFIKVRACL